LALPEVILKKGIESIIRFNAPMFITRAAIFSDYWSRSVIF